MGETSGGDGPNVWKACWPREQATALEPRRRVVWSVAGFDPSSGAGVTADLMTFASYGFFGCSVVTALTVQTTVGVTAAEVISADLVRSTMSALAGDLPPLGIKIGMIGSLDNVREIARALPLLRKDRGPLVVLDPVLRSSSGRELFPQEEITALQKELLPLVDWITPNWGELGALAGTGVRSVSEAELAGRKLLMHHPHLKIVATGGDQQEPRDLLFADGASTETFDGVRVETMATHGTGCAFSSALLAELLLGRSSTKAVRGAKSFVEHALRQAPGLGSGRGPMELLWPLRGREGTGLLR